MPSLLLTPPHKESLSLSLSWGRMKAVTDWLLNPRTPGYLWSAPCSPFQGALQQCHHHVRPPATQIRRLQCPGGSLTTPQRAALAQATASLHGQIWLPPDPCSAGCPRSGRHRPQQCWLSSPWPPPPPATLALATTPPATPDALALATTGPSSAGCSRSHCYWPQQYWLPSLWSPLAPAVPAHLSMAVTSSCSAS